MYRLVNNSISEGQKLHSLNPKHGWEGHENSYVLRKCSCMYQGGTSAIYIWSPPPEHMQQGACTSAISNCWTFESPYITTPCTAQQPNMIHKLEHITSMHPCRKTKNVWEQSRCGVFIPSVEDRKIMKHLWPDHAEYIAHVWCSRTWEVSPSMIAFKGDYKAV
jgi:hypothetical protein